MNKRVKKNVYVFENIQWNVVEARRKINILN